MTERKVMCVVMIVVPMTLSLFSSNKGLVLLCMKF